MKANILGYNNFHLIAIVWKKSRILNNCFCIMVLYRLSEKDKNKVFGGKYQMKIQNAFDGSFLSSSKRILINVFNFEMISMSNMF